MLVAVLVSSAQIRPPAACNTGISPTESFDMYMPAQSVTVTVPPVATIELDAFKYAGDNALVAVPQACATEGAFHFPGLRASNLADRNQPNTSYYFRIDDGWLQSPDAQYEALSQFGYEALSQFGGCACGLVILMHGTTGHMWESVSYGAMLAGMGYLVIAPDSHAMAHAAEYGPQGSRRAQVVFPHPHEQLLWRIRSIHRPVRNLGEALLLLD